MQKSNYALITALYVNKRKGLYSDIYFPIIRYALAKKFSENTDGRAYCTAETISEFIANKFGVVIPTIVIAKSVCKIANGNDPNLNLLVYEKGNTFQISRAVLNNEELDLDRRENFFSEKMNEIETGYHQFISDQGCYDDGVTFLQFITDNTDEIIGYFEKENKSCVNEKYTTLVFFLQYLHESNKVLYEIVNQLFWSSIIVAFLKSEKPLVEDSDNGIKSEYFIDTSIVLGLLDLSTSLKETYSKEVCSIIINSGGILRVNPITIEEIKYILLSVEQNGPNPLTDIAEAYFKRNLIATQLANIRINLESLLSKKHVQVFPVMSPSEIQKVVKEFRGKEITKLLADLRGRNIPSYTHDLFREIHDVYMDAYIKKRRKEKTLEDNVYFLTDNVELVNFCHAQHTEYNYMVSTGQIVLELWMHSTQSIDISNCVLTETMARCFGLHKSSVKSKIVEVAHYYNKTKDDFNPQVYKDFIANLYRRAKYAISAVERLSDEMPASINHLIEEAVAKDKETYNNSLTKFRDSNIELKRLTNIKDKQIEEVNEIVVDLTNKNKSQGETIQHLTIDKEKLSKEIELHKRNLKEANDGLESLLKEKNETEHINKLYKERDKVKGEIEEIQIELRPLESARGKAFHNLWPILLYCLVVVCILIAVLLLIIFFQKIKAWNLSVSAILITIAIAFGNRANTLRDNVEARSFKAYAKWENKEENKKYRYLKEKQNELYKRLNAINKELEA